MVVTCHGICILLHRRIHHVFEHNWLRTDETEIAKRYHAAFKTHEETALFRFRSKIALIAAGKSVCNGAEINVIETSLVSQ